jgi:hypothetical protein
MTAQEAINILTQVAAQSRATLQEHQIIQQALETLKPKEQPKE